MKQTHFRINPKWQNLHLLLILIPAVLLGLGSRAEFAASADDNEASLCGSLRYRAMWIYGATNSNVSEDWRPIYNKMRSIHSGLKAHHPKDSADLDSSWDRFSRMLDSNNRVDWKTCNQLREAADALTNSIEQETHGYHFTAFWLTITGVTFLCMLSLFTVYSDRVNTAAMQARLNSDNRFRVLFEDSSDAHLLFDDSGIIDCNNAAIEMLKCKDKREVLLLHPASLSPEYQPDGSLSLEKCIIMDGLAKKNGFHRFEWIHRKMNGIDFPVEVTLTPVSLQGKDALLVVWHDLTDRKKAEEEMSRTQSRLEEAQSVAGIGSWEYDIAANEITWSKEMYRLTEFDISLKVPSYNELMLRYHPDDVPMHNEVVQKAIQDGLPYAFDIRVLYKDGHQGWMHAIGKSTRDSEGVITHLYGTMMDITKSKTAEIVMRESDQRFRMLLECIGEGIYCIDKACIATIVNPAALKMLGYTSEEFIGQNLHQLLHHSHEDGTPYTITEYPIYKALHGGEKCRIADEVFWCKDGSSLPIEYISTPLLKDGEIVGLVVSFKDVTDSRKQLKTITSAYNQMEEQILLVNEQAVELEHQKSALELANTQLEAFATTDGLTGLKNHRSFQEKLAEEWKHTNRQSLPLSLILLDVDKFKSYNDTYGHPEGDKVLKSVSALMQENSRETDYVCRYGGEEFVIILPNTDVDGAINAAERIRAAIESHPWNQRDVTASFGAATIGAGIDQPQKLIDAADRALYTSKEGGRNCVTHASNLNSMDVSDELLGDTSLPYSNIVRDMLQNQSETLTSASEKIRESLSQAYNATISSWSQLLDMRDKETEGHSERVTKLTVHLAKRIGMNVEEVLYVRWGAMLHDVGKMGIPDHILHKPGKLTEEEWEIMRKHPTIAYDTLSPVAFLLPALDIPYCHHEKWDGSGYPRGLKGNEIPVSARLFCVIDVYDALTSDRSYRAAWSPEKTIAHIESLSGTHFDPRAVKVFLEMMNEKPMLDSDECERIAA